MFRTKKNSKFNSSPILLSSRNTTNTGLASKMARQKWFEFELTMFL
jgi:hypothetical protein